VAHATFGTLNAGRNIAVLLPSWYSSDYHGYDFLIGPGRALDSATFFIVAAEMFASGNSSSPSNTHAGWMFSQGWWRRELYEHALKLGALPARIGRANLINGLLLPSKTV